MNGLFGTDGASIAATWVAAFATLVVIGGLLGERRLFGWSQHLLAGLATGYLAVLAVSEVIVPRLIAPIAADPGAAGEAWIGVAVVGLAAGAPWLPRMAAAIPISIAIGAVAAFALGGAVLGVLLPQLAATVEVTRPDVAGTVSAIAAAGITALVVTSFLHGAPRGRVVAGAARSGRWLLLAGIGGWLGYLVLSRLVLLLDRIGFLLGDWIGVGR